MAGLKLGMERRIRSRILEHCMILTKSSDYEHVEDCSPHPIHPRSLVCNVSPSECAKIYSLLWLNRLLQRQTHLSVSMATLSYLIAARIPYITQTAVLTPCFTDANRRTYTTVYRGHRREALSSK